ncbi:MAG TPA: hypothetical protein VGO90_15275 [Chthoniobacteraceae bacterium]|jgi:hypothetical protein|nr:hypothetical protein [Chthoniobacteraceae bacterium]
MSWFQLDPQSIASRAQAAGSPAPTLGQSVRRGMVGFTIVSLAGFAPWALAGRWFYSRIGEAGLYAVCAVVFIGLAGLLLHRLIIGPGSLSRFYKLFGISFAAYSVAWIVGWMSFRGHTGSLVGLFAGTAVMGVMLASAFDARRETVRVIAALFILNTAGYFIGGWVEGVMMQMKPLHVSGVTFSRRQLVTIGMMLWGLFYGLGFGAGLGLALHFCQTQARALLATGASAARA